MSDQVLATDNWLLLSCPSLYSSMAPSLHPTLSIGAEHLRRLQEGAVVVEAPYLPLAITGPKALDCLQGLLTNDLTKPGPDSLTYGALLTSKGMIVVDAWVIRRAEGFTWLAPASRRDETLAIFRKSLPPRLALVTDQSASHAAYALYGSHAIGILEQAGISPIPVPGGVTQVSFGGWPLLLARPVLAPFALLLVVARDEAAALLTQLTRSGLSHGDEGDNEAARILAGWPGLGTEVDDKTLPQEVRYDDIDGVSYSKGCYVGQETVARLHFRGHANRELRGLVWRGTAPSGTAIEREDGKPGGEISSLLRLPDRSVGLAKIRREILEQGSTDIMAGGSSATVVALPFSRADLTA